MIPVLVLLIRLILCAVFLTAAMAKLRDQGGTRQAVIDFGAPARLSPAIAALLPAIELLLAFALLPLASARLAAGGMVLLLSIFTVVIAVSILRGKRTVCHCFGETGKEAVGWWSVGRNLILGALAGVVAWPKQSGAGESIALLVGGSGHASSVAPIVSLIALFISTGLAWASLNLFRQHGRLLLRIEELEKAKIVVPPSTAAINSSPPAAHSPEGLPIGAPIPRFSLSGIDGRFVSRDDLQKSGKPTLLLFSDPNCGPCTSLLPEIERWSVDHAAQFVVAMVSRGDAALNRKKFSKLRLPAVLVETDERLSSALFTLPTPSALVMQPSGRVGSGVALGADGIRLLVERLSSSHSHNGNRLPPAAQAGGVGAAVPQFQLPALSGDTVSAADLRGTETLLVFWDPACGFCSAMLDDLRRWDASPRDDDPKLLLVSTGGEEANQAIGLSAPVVLDQSFALGRSVGVAGTPSAVLIDEDGNVASDVAVGAPAIWRLLGADVPV